jgi:hypothetical protein
VASSASPRCSARPAALSAELARPPPPYTAYPSTHFGHVPPQLQWQLSRPSVLLPGAAASRPSPLLAPPPPLYFLDPASSVASSAVVYYSPQSFWSGPSFNRNSVSSMASNASTESESLCSVDSIWDPDVSNNDQRETSASNLLALRGVLRDLLDDG